MSPNPSLEPLLEPRIAAAAQQAVSEFNALADELRLVRVQRLTARRRNLLNARLAECGGLDGWREIIARIRGSPGLLGENGRAWKIGFDWLIDETHFARLAEGQYDDDGTPAMAPTAVAGGAKVQATACSPALLPPPIARLVASDSTDWRLPERVTPEAASVLPALVRDLEHALRPADPRELAAVIGELMLHFWHPDRPPEHHSTLAAGWIDDLAEYPAAVVAEAARQWRRTGTWAPRIAELRGLCDEILARRQRQLLRSRFLLGVVERHGGAVPVVGRRIGDELVDYHDRATDRDLELSGCAASTSSAEIGCGRPPHPGSSTNPRRTP